MVPVSAVVSAHNEEKHVAECLESVLGQTVRVDELMLINDRSTDRTVDIASKYPVDIYDVEYGQIYMVKRAGICAARNDVVLSVDGDTTIAPDFLERGLRHLEEGYDAATGNVLSVERTPLGDIVSFVANVLPKGVYYSGPGYVLDRHRYMTICKVSRIGDGFIDVCTGEGEIPLHRMNLIKDPLMIMWTELPSTGQRRMIAGVRAIGGLLTAMRVLA